MSENNQSMKGRAFCDVTNCKHNLNKRCDHRMLKDVDDFTVTKSDSCKDYDRLPLKHYCIDLNEDEVSDLLTLLEPSSDEGDPGEELYNKLYNVTHKNPIAEHMWFVNTYCRYQRYGGPEEGGWWYHSTCCEESRAFDSIDWNQPEMHNFQYLVDMYLEVLQSVIDDFKFEDEIKESIEYGLKENSYYELGQLNEYGEGYFVAIERQPGAQHNVERQHYC